MQSASLLLLAFMATTTDACTSIIVGKKATKDGSVMTTHNNDCTDCDIRIVNVPARQYKDLNSTCPVWPCKFSFPRFVSEDRADGYTAQATKAENIDIEIHPTKPYTYIDQVEETYSYLDGTYGLVNEFGLAMGESTCSGKLVAYGYPRGDALFDVSALGRLALERCKTARCAVKVMGELGEKYGYYGANDPAEEGMGMYEEAGEAMTIIDNTGESWVFHILPDDSGKSAVWAAQRVPDEHIAVVANSFIIREIDLNDNGDNFLFSKNVVDVAVRAGFWDKDKKPFDFSSAYSPDGNDGPGWGLRRTWRIFDLVAPSLKLDSEMTTPLPFSIKPEKLISLDDMMAFKRDRFEGSKFDLSVGPASGPWGNPNRYDPSGRPEYWGGYFERAISLHRTTYSFVAQSRPWVAAPASTILWFAHHSPHSSLYVPLYGAAAELPASYETGNVFRFDRTSAWWAYAAVNNFAEKQYSFMYQDIKAAQVKYETDAQKKTAEIDDKVNNEKDPKKVLKLLTDYTNENAEQRVKEWYALLDFLFTKYRDGARLEAFVPPVNTMPLFYPAWWLGSVGYYNNGPQGRMFSWVPKPVQPPPHPDQKPWVLASVDDAAMEQVRAVAHPAAGKRFVDKEVAKTALYDESSFSSLLNGGAAAAVQPMQLAESSMNLQSQPAAAFSFITFLGMAAAIGVAFVAGRKFEKRQEYNNLN